MAKFVCGELHNCWLLRRENQLLGKVIKMIQFYVLCLILFMLQAEDGGMYLQFAKCRPLFVGGTEGPNIRL